MQMSYLFCSCIDSVEPRDLPVVVNAVGHERVAGVARPVVPFLSGATRIYMIIIHDNKKLS